METNSLIIIIGTLFTFSIILLGGAVIAIIQKRKTQALISYNDLQLTRQQEISRNTLLSQEKERQRIGLELHDDLGPTFAAISVDIKRIRTSIEKGNSDKASQIANETSIALKDAVTKFSEVSRILYPVIFNREGLKAAIENIADRYNETSSIHFTLDYSLHQVSNELTKLVIYRVFQELTTNAIKHSEATTVHVKICNTSDFIELHYTDDGIGFDTDIKSKGLGLHSIKGRVEALNGTIDILNEAKKGLKVKIIIPND